MAEAVASVSWTDKRTRHYPVWMRRCCTGVNSTSASAVGAVGGGLEAFVPILGMVVPVLGTLCQLPDDCHAGDRAGSNTSSGNTTSHLSH